MSIRWHYLPVLAGLLTIATTCNADVRMPAIFGDHMVLQQGQKDRVWGWADPGEDITVTIDQQTHKTKAGSDGKWSVMLNPMSVGAPTTLSVQGRNALKFDDVLIGEVTPFRTDTWPGVTANAK